MPRSVSRRACRADQNDIRKDDPSPFLGANPTCNQASHTSLISAVAATPNSDAVPSKDLLQTGLTLEEIEAIIPHEYAPLTPWTARKLCLEYGVRDLPNPDLPERPHLKMVAPIAEELVHDTIVRLWEKAKERRVELNNAGHVRGWLKNALKFALLQWIQNGAREYGKRVYPVETKSNEQDPIDAEIIELWDAGNKESVWHQIQSVFDRAIGDCSTGASEQEQAVSNEVNAALQLLPRVLQKLINQVYCDKVSWKEASAPLDIEGKTLEREVQRCLRTLRPYVPSYHLNQRWVRDTRRARKSFHCPVCETTLKRSKDSKGAVCPGCRIGINKAQFAIKYSYHHA